MSQSTSDRLISLDLNPSIWERFFTVAPLVVIGTQEPDGSYDLAPKHMAMPLGWGNYFGFMCTPRHQTYQNIRRTQAFTVSFPQPNQVVATSLAAAPRCNDDHKPSLAVLPTVHAKVVDGVFLQGAYLCLECELDRIVDGFDENSLIAGRILAAHVDEAALRLSARDDQDLLRQSPLLAYLSPGRYACIDHSQSFPFHEGFQQ
ncbi:flavin reductase family protein [Vacuolonema iberomarrocanum]|uniref:flavin reductase family protein n=1 Tax=Vacuolonema iberomarrocanum TaxID=3454632 RepID=UPI0019DBA57F|nr:flavin reductase [filamentous cyanobacterium LEGE 07170]